MNMRFWLGNAVRRSACAVSRCTVARDASIRTRHLHRSAEERENVHEIVKWRNVFTPSKIPRKQLVIRYARSSGPGGQNVNKVNTKADVRFVIRDAAWLPDYAKEQLVLKFGRRCLNAKGEFVVSSDRHRTQQKNVEDCIGKLHGFIMIASQPPSETSPEKLIRVNEMKKRNNEKRLAMKRRRSEKSKARQRAKNWRSFDD